MSLRKHAISGVKWNFGAQAGQQIAQLATMVVLARLLKPSDFGLVGMATVVTAFVSLFKDLGTSAAIIHRRDLTDELLSSVFWMNVGIGILGTLLLASFAPLVAMYYREPQVSAILRVLSLSFAISGLTILQAALLERGLQFRTVASTQLAGVGCGAIAGIASALAGAGVWALVIQSLTSASVITILLWWSTPWRPQWIFRWREVRSIGSYSLNLVGFNTFNYFSRNADNLLIGRYLGPTALGIYALAYRIMLYPLQTIATVISRVMFPVYAHLQDDDARFRSAYLRTAGVIALVTFPMMIGLWMVARPFVLTVFGAKWLQLVPLIEILAPIGMLQSIGTTVGAIYQAKGNTRALFYWGIGSGAVLVSGFAVGLRWGIVGVATTYAIVTIGLMIPNFVIPFRLIGLRLRSLVAVLVRPLAASLLMALVIAVVRTLVVHSQPHFALQLMLATGILVYIFASWQMDRDQFRQVLALLGGKL